MYCYMYCYPPKFVHVKKPKKREILHENQKDSKCNNLRFVKRSSRPIDIKSDVNSQLSALSLSTSIWNDIFKILCIFPEDFISKFIKCYNAHRNLPIKLYKIGGNVQSLSVNVVTKTLKRNILMALSTHFSKFHLNFDQIVYEVEKYRKGLSSIMKLEFTANSR